MLRQMKSQPFVALVVDEGGEDVHVYHTTGIDREALAAIRQQLDDIEASLPPVGGT